MTKKETLSKIKKAILYAVSKGYTVNDIGEILNPKGKKLKGWVSNKGYHFFNTSFGSVPVHQLVAYQKYGGEYLYNKKLEVRHLDGNPLNNCFENIDIGTHQDNMLDVPKEVRTKRSKMANSKDIMVRKKETYKKIKHAQGENNSQYGTFWITNGKENKKWSYEKGEIPDSFIKGRTLK